MAAGNAHRGRPPLSGAKRVVVFGVAAGLLGLTLVGLRLVRAFIPRAASAKPDVAMHGADVYGDPIPEGAVTRLGTLRFRGQGPAIWAPDGRHLLVGGWDDRILALDATTGLVEWTMSGHSRPFTRELDPTNLRELARAIRYGALRQEEDRLEDLTLLPDGRLLSAGYSHRIWDLATHAEVRCIPLRGGSASPAVVSPDGKSDAFDWVDSVRFVDLVAGREAETVKIGVNVLCIAWAPAGDSVFAGLQDGRLAIVHRGGIVPPICFQVAAAPIVGILVADAGRRLWVLDGTGTVTIRSLGTDGGPDQKVPPPVPVPQPGIGAWVGHMSASPDGATVAVSLGGTCRFLDARTGTPVHGPSPPGDAHGIGWSSDGRFAWWSSGSIRVTGSTPPDTNGFALSSIAWSPNGSRIATGCQRWSEPGTGCVRVWDAATGRSLWTADAAGPVMSIAWQDERTVLLGSKSQVLALDAGTGTRKWVHDTGGPAAVLPRVGARGEGALWIDGDRDLHVLDLRNERHELPVTHLATKPATGEPLGALLPSLSGAVLLENVPRRPDENGTWSSRLRVRIWRFGAATADSSIDVTSDRMLALSPDGHLAVAGNADVIDLTASPPRVLGRLALPGGRDRIWVLPAAIAADASRAAVADSDGGVHVYALPSCVEQKVFFGHRGPVTCLAFSPDGARLVSGSVDTTALVWDLR